MPLTERRQQNTNQPRQPVEFTHQMEAFKENIMPIESGRMASVVQSGCEMAENVHLMDEKFLKKCKYVLTFFILS